MKKLLTLILLAGATLTAYSQVDLSYYFDDKVSFDPSIPTPEVIGM